MDILTILATFLFLVFAFGYGACFGSFLNVVVWRLPSKMPIMLARSHCPKCRQDIWGSDNIPIFGWLRLRGKCRFCQLPISARYPLVETGVALLFAVLFALIVIAHGVTLPTDWMHQHRISWLSEFPGCPLLVVWGDQVVLGYFLLALALVDEDRQQMPYRWLILGLVVHLGLLLIEPSVGMMDYLSATAGDLAENRGNLPDAACFSGVGIVCGFAVALLTMLFRLPHQLRNGIQSLLLLGGFLGPAVLVWCSLIGFSSLICQWILGRFGKKQGVRTGLSAQLFLAWLLVLMTWRWWPEGNWLWMQELLPGK
ncbi:MAG: prepilin peptidase [Planctomycetaceae bacterium]|nr:prepilin peptidase [Planctomycetaceae bacterium]